MLPRLDQTMPWPVLISSKVERRTGTADSEYEIFELVDSRNFSCMAKGSLASNSQKRSTLASPQAKDFSHTYGFSNEIGA